MTSDNERDRLDELLDASAPTAPEPSWALRAEAGAMIAAAEHGDRHQRRRRQRLSRSAIAAVAAGSVLSLGGLSAAAATFDQWSPWAQDENAGISFTMPSGAACEYRVGGFEKMSDEAAQAVRDYVANVELQDIADIDGALQQLREQEHSEIQDDGSVIVGGYGTDRYYTPDHEYHVAVTLAVGDALDAELSRLGFEGADYMGEAFCAEYTW